MVGNERRSISSYATGMSDPPMYHWNFGIKLCREWSSDDIRLVVKFCFTPCSQADIYVAR